MPDHLEVKLTSEVFAQKVDSLRTIVAVTSGLRMAPRETPLRFRLVAETLA